MYKFVRGHFIAGDHNSTVTACTAADLDDLIFSRWLQSATAGAIARHLIIAQSYCHRAAISMKHHVARAIVLTRPLYANWISYFRRENCTRSPAIITRHRPGILRYNLSPVPFAPFPPPPPAVIPFIMLIDLSFSLQGRTCTIMST